MDSAQDSQLLEEWRNTLQLFRDTSCDLEAVLQEKYDLGVSEFEVLERIWDFTDEHEGDDNCLLKQLEGRIHLSQSALSRTVTRLVKDELVERVTSENDRRAAQLQLTDAGRERYLAAKPTHRQILHKHFS